MRIGQMRQNALLYYNLNNKVKNSSSLSNNAALNTALASSNNPYFSSSNGTSSGANSVLQAVSQAKSGQSTGSSTTGQSTNMQYMNRFTPTATPFSKPDFNSIDTRQKASMTDDQFQKAIAEQAQKDKAAGGYMTQDAGKLQKSYVQTASPDRAAIYTDSMSKTGGKMNAANSFYDAQGNNVMSWNTSTNKWDVNATAEETARTKAFTAAYNQAWSQAPAAAASSSLVNTKA